MAKGIKSTPGRRKRKIPCPKVYITSLGRSRIEQVRKELDLSQFALLGRLVGKTHRYKITQVDISDWFLGKKPIPLIFCKPIYEALDKDERIDFLQNYSPDEENRKKYTDFLVDYLAEKRKVISFDAFEGVQRFIRNTIEERTQREFMGLVNHEREVLRPLYSKIVGIYCRLSDSERKEICGELEQLVQKYKGD